MKKFDIRFCGCGRIHAIPQKEVDNAIVNNKELVHVCTNCGNVLFIGADKQYEPYIGHEVYNMYTTSTKDHFEISADSFTEKNHDGKPFANVIFDNGIKVPMKTGRYANSYFDGQFADDRDCSMGDPLEEKMVTVDIKWLLKNTSDEELRAISKYYIKGLDWTGTKYKR